MDIITHAGIGLIVGMSVVNQSPELALGFTAGSVLPDLDSLSRLFGKTAFLRSHQSWTHALPMQALASLIAGLGLSALGSKGMPAGLGLFLGMALHTLLDLSNTLGVRWLAPFSRRRWALEWVFFIDGFMLLLTGICTTGALAQFLGDGSISALWIVSYGSVAALYFAAKGLMRFLAGRIAPGSISLVPSALLPWRFYGTASSKDGIRSFRLSALTGEQTTLAIHPILDAAYEDVLTGIREFQLMRELSPAYHLIRTEKQADGQHLLCRDLRTRNFATAFGDLELWLDGARRVKRIHFHA